MYIRTILKYIACSEKELSASHCRLFRTSFRKYENQSTDFGFQKVREDEKQEKVNEVFSNVADTYDVMNDAMSLGIHRVWKNYFVQQLSPSSGCNIIDVAGGTGDIAFRIQDYMLSDKLLPYSELETRNESHVTICDINQNMLDVGKRRAEEDGRISGLTWVQGNAEELPFKDDQFDAYTIAFGIRNCTHIDKVLSEANRIIKPGGRFLCLEFSSVSNALLQKLYDQYSFQVIPVMGKLIANDWNSYQYLVESIRKFPDQESFAQMLKDAGFKCVTYENLSSGIAAIHSGLKL